MRRLFRWVSALALAILLAGCGTSTTRLAGQVATATPLPTATPRPTVAPTPTLKPIPRATLGADGHPCYADAMFSSQPGANLGDLVVVSAQLSNLNYGARKLPDDLPLKPLVVSQGGSEFPVEPVTNPGTSVGGWDFALCNTSTSASHRLDGVSVRINALVPRAAPVNEWPSCGGTYSRSGPLGHGCGGGDPRDVNLHASFVAGASEGASAAAMQVGEPNSFRPFKFEPVQMTSLPITLGPGDGLVINVTFDLPSPSGTYTFGFGVAEDGSTPGYVSTAEPVLLASVAHNWTGDACLTPAMQAQIPPATNPPSYYLCPNV